MARRPPLNIWEQVSGNQANSMEFTEGLTVAATEFTPFLSDPMYDNSLEPSSMMPFLSRPNRQTRYQAPGEITEGLGEESLSHFPYMPRYHPENVITDCLSDSSSDESLAFLESLNTALPDSLAVGYPISYHTPLQLYQYPFEQPIDNTINPTNAMAVGPFQRPIHVFADAESSCAGSPNSTAYNCRLLNINGTWRCAYQGCKSPKTFARMCDFRRHFQYHLKYLSCRHSGCPKAVKGSFATPKDLARHEATHERNVYCEWKGCGRLFSRKDHMLDHVKRIHLRQSHNAMGKRHGVETRGRKTPIHL